MYDIFINLKSRLKLYISRLRCDVCFAPYSKRCPIYLCESGSDFNQNKNKFSIESKPASDKMNFVARFPLPWNIKSGQHLYYKSFATARLVSYPSKERVTRNVLSLEVYCTKCNSFKELEIDLDDFLPKKYSNASVHKPITFQNEEDEE